MQVMTNYFFSKSETTHIMLGINSRIGKRGKTVKT